MSTRPAKLIKASMTNEGPIDFLLDPDSIWNGYPITWRLRLMIEPQPMSFVGSSGVTFFMADDISPGDWIASGIGGIAVKITKIVELVDNTNIVVEVIDEDQFNMYSDSFSSGSSIGPDGASVVFEVNPINGMPILSPMPVNYIDYPFQADLISRFFYLNKLKGLGGGGGGGGSDVLTDTSSGTYNDGYIKGWQVGLTKVSDAFRSLNVALTEVQPASPPSLNLQYLQVEGGLNLVAGNPIVLASGALNNTGLPDSELPAFGTPIRRLTRSKFNTTEIGPFGPGNRGDLELIVNKQSLGKAELDVGSDVGTYGQLEITTDTAYPRTQPGFHEALTVRGVDLVPQPGINYVQITHSGGTASAREFFAYDTSQVLPSISNVGVDVAESSVFLFSSGIPHLGRGSSLIVAGTVSDLATDITYDRRNIDIVTSPVEVGPTTWLSPGSKGLPSGFIKGGTDGFAGANYDIVDTLDNPAYGTVDLKIIARNPNGSTEYTYERKINVMRGGTPTGIGPLDEVSVPVLDLGDMVEGKPLSGFRVILPNDLTPAADLTDMPGEWDSAATIPLHEASVVGGAAVADLVDYSTYIPPGPNYSAKYGSQYITFALCRSAVSKMKVEVRGSFSRMFVKLPGVTDLPLAVNGWWDAGLPYEGAGTPGRGISAGCAIGTPAFGFDQDVMVTFGSESSAYSNNNLILVRFMLEGSNRITGIRFSGVA